MAACPSTLAATPLNDTHQDDVFLSDTDDGLLMLNNEDMDRFAPEAANDQRNPLHEKREEDKISEKNDAYESVMLCTEGNHFNEEDVAVVIEEQPRRNSDPNSLFQPSQIEGKLLNDRLLNAEGGAEVAVKKTAAKARSRDAASATTIRRRRASIWNGVVACLTPVMGYFKKEKQPKTPEDEWEIDFADISELNFIGSGAQGAVFAGMYLGRKVAVKKVKDPKYCQEAWNMRKLDHTNIVKMT